MREIHVEAFSLQYLACTRTLIKKSHISTGFPVDVASRMFEIPAVPELPIKLLKSSSKLMS